MENSPETPPGIFASLRSLLHSLSAIAGNRAELFAVEVREEGARWVGALLLAAATAALGIITVVMISVTIVVVCWDEHRTAALVGLSTVYLLATVALALGLRWRLQHWPSFSATITELKKDQLWLKEKP